MSAKKILVVEDEPPIREMLRFALERADYSVTEAGDAQAARIAIADDRPDLILLDWMLPDVSGVELAREFRSDAGNRDIPIIMVTARAEEADRVKGLDTGADDYVTKPFSASELVARVRAVLRRTQPGGEDELIQVNGLEINAASQRVTVDGGEVKLGPTEYRLLYFFASHPDRVYSREQLLDRVWGQNVYVEERTVDVHIRRLRKALTPFRIENYIQTVRGSGYRFSAQI